jgi:hypothetical protein
MKPLRIAATVYAVTRVVYGVALAASPEKVGGPWVGKGARRHGAKIGLRGLGARDAAIGAGVIGGAAGAWDARPWLVACALGDAADMSATLAADPEKLPGHARAATVALAGTYGAIALGLAIALRDD